MKVLWLCNIVLPDIAESENLPKAFGGGWMTYLSKQVSNCEDIELCVCSPSKYIKVKKEGEINGLSYILFNPSAAKNVKLFHEILEQFKPDLVHIFGTEYLHSYTMIKTCKDRGILDSTIVGIQGMVSVVAKHYFSFLPNKIIHRYTLRDILLGANIYNQQKQFVLRGNYEEKTLSLAKHVIGRTDWDKACTLRLNPNLQYHFCNETLRKPFYENEWSLDKCEKHSIFVSQSTYPIKGFHLMLEAMADVVKVYPDVHLYTTGQNPLKLSFKQKLRQTYYNKYLGKLIKKYKLENNVTFLGYLDEHKMCERYLKAHVFVSPSTLENSPNSVGEAMILGVPTVSTDVGGVKNLLKHGKEGFVYQSDAPYMAAYYIKQVFADDDLALEFSKNSKLHANELYNSETNLEKLLHIYKEILK